MSVTGVVAGHEAPFDLDVRIPLAEHRHMAEVDAVAEAHVQHL